MDEYENTLLHHACWGGNMEVVKFLIDTCGCNKSEFICAYIVVLVWYLIQ